MLRLVGAGESVPIGDLVRKPFFVPETKALDDLLQAGLVFSELGYIPQIDETLHAFGADFAVLAADERKITRLRVKVV